MRRAGRRTPAKPLFKRPAILGLLLPFALIAMLVIGNLDSPLNLVGQCVMNEGTSSSPDIKKADCGSPDADYRIVGKLDNTTDDTQCEQFAGYEASLVSQRGSYTLCLAPV